MKRRLDEDMTAEEKDEFKKKLRAGEVKFKFMKKDGTERIARGTMNPDLMDLPKKLEDKNQGDVDKSEKKQARKLPGDSVFFYDLDKKGFRSFKMNNFIGYL